MNTITRLFFNSSQAQTNDFIAKTAMKTITFDFPSNSEGWFEKTSANWSNVEDLENQKDYLDIWGLCSHTRFIPMAINYDSLHFAIRDCQAPQDYGFNVIRLYPQKRNADSTATVGIHFKGHLESAASELKKKSGWRWAFVSVSADGIPRYGAIHSDADGVATYNMQADDKELYLVVTGAPTAQDANHLYHWEAGLVKYYRYPYEFRLQNAVPYGYNADYEVPQGTTLHVHSNGGGLVARTASVAATAYVGPHAKVLGSARVMGNARIEDFAVVKGSAVVSDSAVVKENALVMTNAKVRGGAIVSGSARVMNSSVVSDTAFVTDNAFLSETAISGNAIACGNLWQRDASPFKMSGTFIAGGDDESAGNSYDGAESKGTFLQWPESGNNGRKRLDGRGNMSVMFIRKLRDNWNNLSIRYKILNSSCKENADVNLPYTPFADSELAVAAVAPDSVATFTVVRNGLPNGRYYVIDPKTGGFLTSDGKSAPVFAVRDASNAGQIWSIEKSQSLLKYCFRDSVGRTIHADGSISSTGTATSASYAFDLTQRVDQDLYSVYCKSTGYYWKVYGEKLRVKGFNIQNAIRCSW
jgi:carbonic anhydrase/acetyltransferase-like protein (isoleucine patch superfamily)